MRKKILITGASGMVGKSLIKILKKKKYKILSPSSKELNLLDQNSIENFLKKNKPFFVIHLAGYIGGIGASINEPINFLQENILMGINLIKSSHKLKIKNFINIGSSCIYPPNQTKPIKENQLLNGKIEKTNEGYAIAKISCIKLCEYISTNYKYNYFTLIPCNIYGPHDKFDEYKGHVVGSLIKKIFLAKKYKKANVEIWGSGKVFRELIYVDDVSNAITKFMFNKKLINKQIFWLNIGFGENVMINTLAKKIAKILNFKGKFNNNLNKPDGVRSKLMSSELSNKYGWKVRVNLDDGLKKTISWFVKSQH
tara:strand:+ start:702 stop:1634 length:933 start_codon:yes stop_codon:yes gene_type:complete